MLLNQFGLVNLAIGNGTEETGDFTTIDWGADSNFYKSRLIQPTGYGTNSLNITYVKIVKA